MQTKKGLLVLFGVCLIILSTYFIFCNKFGFYHPDKEQLYLDIRNETNETIKLSAFVYVNMGLVKFSNITVTNLEGNFLVRKIEDESGIQLHVEEFEPESVIKLKVQNITVTPQLSLNLSKVRLRLQGNFNESDIGYEAVFSVYNLYGISIASKHFLTIKLNHAGQYVHYEERTNPEFYLNVLFLISSLIGLANIFLAIEQKSGKNRVRNWFPFISVVLVWLTIFVYIFIGSGSEINYFVTDKNLKAIFSIFSFLIHGFNKHINRNLVYFSLNSILLETFIKIRKKHMKRDLFLWYFLPLIFPGLTNVPAFLLCGEFSYGLSFSIEIMTWSLWAYILMHYKELIEKRIYIFMTILSGIPSITFFEWFIGYIMGNYTKNPYYQNLATRHVSFGIMGAIVICILAYFYKKLDFQFKNRNT